MKTVYAHIGPMELSMIGPVIMQCYPQGWIKEDILFAGMGVARKSVVLPGMNPTGPSFSLYYLLFRKDHDDNSEVKLPKINLPGVTCE